MEFLRSKHTTAREAWWDGLDTSQRRHLLRTAGASDPQRDAFQAREWYQLSLWMRKSICRLRDYQLTVPLPQNRCNGPVNGNMSDFQGEV